MKAVGIVRKVDELGRIVLPKETRDMFDIKIKDPVEIYVSGDAVILKKYHPGCVFCDSMEDVKYFQGKYICENCIKELRRRG